MLTDQDEYGIVKKTASTHIHVAAVFFVVRILNRYK